MKWTVNMSDSVAYINNDNTSNNVAYFINDKLSNSVEYLINDNTSSSVMCFVTEACFIMDNTSNTSNSA